MSRRIVWEDVNVRLYVDGIEAGAYFATSLSVDEIIEVDRAKVQGSSQPDLDGTYNGARGSVEFLLVDGYSDPRDVYEVQRDAIRDRVPGGEIRAVFSRRVPGKGLVREALRVGPMIVQPSERASENQRWTHTWNFDAEEVVRVAA